MPPKPYQAELAIRKAKIKHNKYNRKYVKRHPTIPNFITAVYCKGCGTQIKGLNSENTLVPYWNYREITIEFDNGSAHMTPACIKCANVSNKENLEAMYVADLEEFDIEDDGADAKIWNVYLDRIPTKIRKETPRRTP